MEISGRVSIGLTGSQKRLIPGFRTVVSHLMFYITSFVLLNIRVTYIRTSSSPYW